MSVFEHIIIFVALGACFLIVGVTLDRIEKKIDALAKSEEENPTP